MNKLYKAKSLAGAQTRVRQLEKLHLKTVELLDQFAEECKLLAMMAADTPQFDNPYVAMGAKSIRDKWLRKAGRL